MQVTRQLQASRCTRGKVTLVKAAYLPSSNLWPSLFWKMPSCTAASVSAITLTPPKWSTRVSKAGLYEAPVGSVSYDSSWAGSTIPLRCCR